MNIITRVIDNLNKNFKENVKNYELTNILSANVVFSFNNYIKMVKCIDDISYEFSTFLYTTFVEQIDEAFFNSQYRKKYCEVINTCERSLITLFGEVYFTRRYYHDNLKNTNFYYVDKVLNIKPYSRFDPFVCAKICEVSSHDSYAKAGRTVSELIGRRLKFYDDLDRYIINRAQARNMVMNFDIPNIEYTERPTNKKLYVMLDEKWVHSQHNDGKDFMVKAVVVFENIEKVYKKTKRKNKIRYKLVGKRVLASIDNDLQKQVDDYIYNTYIVEDIDEIVFMGDCAYWIKAFPDGFKYHKDLKITFSMDGFHLAQAIQNIATTKYPEIANALNQCCFDNNKDDFIAICDALIENSPSREETINSKKEYILNNWEFIQIYFHRNPMKCSMEAHISHCFADIFTSRPRAYSEKGLRQLLKLRLLKVNEIDIQKTYFDVLNGKYNNSYIIDDSIFDITFENNSKNNYLFPQWMIEFPYKSYYLF